MILSMIIFGILLIILSIILIVKYREVENTKYNEIIKIYNEIVEYSDIISGVIIDLESMIKNENSQKESYIIESNYNISGTKDDYATEDYTRKIKEEVIDLYKDGNSIDEIAKRLNKGKREVEMMVKLNNFNKIKKKS
ncbi:hypothetical protein GOQ27_15470 [Clostridium sp. D2Q-11]|uniref:Resolvase HTH domain-containing protein n=1 Tax=Anaeromonas frigoriresistens TaxID=2683708 RepID=A0A942ZA57_9FIRM|nr:hypothetical protein [Anaeromonas frigoriresistens]MBS4539874.1 hypothetical protein [Anaeromonas frigoriresistens]